SPQNGSATRRTPTPKRSSAPPNSSARPARPLARTQGRPIGKGGIDEQRKNRRDVDVSRTPHSHGGPSTVGYRRRLRRPRRTPSRSRPGRRNDASWSQGS